MTDEHPWHRSVLTLLLPDAIHRQVHLAILHRIEQAGYEVAHFELLQVRPEQLDALYSEQIRTAWEAYRYRLLDKLWALGPVVGLVLRDVTGGAEDPHARMKRLKGATDPAGAAVGTIRRDFGGINAMLSLMHAADQPAVSAREAGMLLRAKVSADAPPHGDPCDGSAAADAHTVLGLLTTSPAETRGFTEVLAEHRARVLGAAWPDLAPDGRALAAAALRDATLTRVGAGVPIAAGLRGGPVHPAHALLTAEWRPGLPALPEAELLARCAALGLPRDPWTEIVLLTSAYFTPVR